MSESEANGAADDAPLVMIVDDDADYAKLLAMRLRAAGVRTEHVPTAIGLSARMLRTPTIALLMLDCMMPALTGPAVLDLLAKNPRLIVTPVVLMSALPEYQDAVAAHPRAVFVEKSGHVQAIVSAAMTLLGRPASTPSA